MTGSIEKAQELAREYPNSFIPGQFENPANPLAHVKTTGPEIWADTDGKVDIFRSRSRKQEELFQGVGTYLKSKNPGVKIVGVEPEKPQRLLARENSLVPILYKELVQALSQKL